MAEDSLRTLLNFAENISPKALAEAEKTDATDLFPEYTLGEIKGSNILCAVIKSKYGGQNLGLIPGTNESLLKILKYIGGGNLVMGRVLEGHINAQLLIDQFGDDIQKEMFAKDAFEGNLFGVWNTQAENGTTLTKSENANYVLNGSKIFATGTGYVTRPIITAALEDGSWQMCVVPIDEIEKKVDSSWWDPMGMKASRSYKVTFENVIISKENLLGNPNDYYSQPQFSGGAVRFAAVQLGAIEMLLLQTIEYLKSLKRTDDPYQKMRLGEMSIAVTSGNLWLKGAAKKMDKYMKNPSDQNAEILLTHTNMMRTAIEKIATEVMALCQKSVGARGLNKPYHFERIIRDLNTYLRQPAPDASLADVGRFALQMNTEISSLWKNTELHD